MRAKSIKVVKEFNYSDYSDETKTCDREDQTKPAINKTLLPNRLDPSRFEVGAGKAAGIALTQVNRTSCAPDET